MTFQLGFYKKRWANQLTIEGIVKDNMIRHGANSKPAFALFEVGIVSFHAW